MLHDAECIVEEVFFVDMDADEFWQLVEQDDETDAGLEAGEYRSGDQVGDKAQAQYAGEHENDADQGG